MCIKGLVIMCPFYSKYAKGKKKEKEEKYCKPL